MARTDFLISAAELAEQLAVPQGPASLRIFDCRADLGDLDAGRRLWAAGHIPGALHADLGRDLSDLSQPASLGRHPLPDPVAFADWLSRLELSPDQQIVAYDSGPGALAARLWWLLRTAGWTRVRVLDGGLKAWLSAGGRLEEATYVDDFINFSTVSLLDWKLPAAAWLDNNDLAAGLKDGSLSLIDAREAARYRGEIEPIDRIAGHIPGAQSRPYLSNLDDDGRFQPEHKLHAEFSALLGARSPDQVVHQCGSGVTACHNLLAMEIAGLAGSRLHAPSYSGWIAEQRPVATGSNP